MKGTIKVVAVNSACDDLMNQTGEVDLRSVNSHMPFEVGGESYVMTKYLCRFYRDFIIIEGLVTDGKSLIGRAVLEFTPKTS